MKSNMLGSMATASVNRYHFSILEWGSYSFSSMFILDVAT